MTDEMDEWEGGGGGGGGERTQGFLFYTGNHTYAGVNRLV